MIHRKNSRNRSGHCKQVLVLALALFAIVACQGTPPPTPPQKPVRVEADTSVKLTVSYIKLADNRRELTPLKPGTEDVTALSPYDPRGSLMSWAQDHLEAVGGEYSARFVVVEARLLRLPAENDDTFTGWFRNAIEEDRYELVLDAAIEVLNPRGYLVAHTNSGVRREEATSRFDAQSDIQDMLGKMVSSALQEMDAELRRSIPTYLELFVDGVGESPESPSVSPVQQERQDQQETEDLSAPEAGSEQDQNGKELQPAQ